MAKDNRFWVLDYDEADHYDDLIKSAKAGELVCLVDEEAGGIVAYVIDPAGYKRTDEFAEIFNSSNGNIK